MRISRAYMVVLLFLCGLAGGCLGVAAKNDSPVLGADMPLYPALARTANNQGRVEVQVITGADGKVISAQVKSGFPLLKRAAPDNVKTWRFAGRSERTITFEFKIEERAPKVFDDYYNYGKIIFHRPNSMEIIFSPAIVEN